MWDKVGRKKGWKSFFFNRGELLKNRF